MKPYLDLPLNRQKKPFFRVLTLLVLLIGSAIFPAFASVTTVESGMDWFQMAMWLAGGLAMFLFGMDHMVNGLLIVAGDHMKNLLAKLTTNRVMAALTGAGVTAVIQSSSVTTVLTVGFVSAGLMSVSQAAGVVMGANLGTTITAQIVAFKITNFALLMIAVGFFMEFSGKLQKTKAIGKLIMGLGLIFFGMNIMSEGMTPLRSYEPFLDLMLDMQNPFLAILIAAVFTALVQSSSATIGIVIVMASNGFLSLPAGIALAMGANIGTTITAMLATIGKSKEALRTALIHVQFNVLAVLIWLPFIPDLAQAVTAFMNYEASTQGLSELALLAERTPREIAHANTLFNLMSLILFLPLIPVFLWVVHKLVPRTEDEHSAHDIKAENLDPTFINTPSVAFDAVFLELENYQKRQSLFYKRMVALIADPKFEKLTKEMANIQKFRNYQQEVLRYLGQIGQGTLTDTEQQTYTQLMTVLHSLESMNIAMRDSVFDVLMQMVENKIQPSDTMLELVGQLTNEVGKAMEKSLLSVINKDSDMAYEVFASKQTIDHLIQEALNHQMRHLHASEKRLMVFRYEMRMVEGFKQLYSMSKRIARMYLSHTQANENSTLD